MQSYGSIASKEEEQPASSSKLELINNDDVVAEETTYSPRSSWRSWMIKTGPKLLAATVLLKVAAVVVSTDVASNINNNQLFQLANPFAMWGRSHNKKWKTFIRKDNDPLTQLYHTQIVDHNHPHKSGTFQQRYYENLHFWDGPGHPLFVILGGEGPLEHILYPFISDVLAKVFGGVTLNPEHRYFGVSYPVKNPSNHILREQMTPKQAMEDFVHFIQAMQAKLGCSDDKGSDDYCPVITVGGSYPGLLSVLLRINYPGTIDIGYGGGVPFHTWDNSHPIESAYEYYDYITFIAERESPGCSSALKNTLMATLEEMMALDDEKDSRYHHSDISAVAEDYGVCPKTVPKNIKTAESLARRLIGKVPGRYSETNMEYYPPGPDRLFIKDCKVFQNQTVTPKERFRNFLLQAAKTDQSKDCYDLGGSEEADEADEGKMWSILCCYLAPVMGRSEQSMFYPEKFKPEDDIEACQVDFGITMDPSAMVREFKFSYEDLQKQSRILLTNGDNDGWSALSYHEDINDSVVAMNFANGAHHSELLHFWTPDNNHDTPDIRQGHEEIINLIGEWLQEIKQTEMVWA